MILAEDVTPAAAGLPDWVQIVGFLLVTTMGAGFGSTLLTGWLNRRKLDSEVAVGRATAEKTSVEVATELVNTVSEQLAKALARIEVLEAKNASMEAQMAELKRTTEQETATLRAANALLLEFIAEVKRKWSQVTTEPFQDYETWEKNR